MAQVKVDSKDSEDDAYICSNNRFIEDTFSMRVTKTSGISQKYFKGT